MATTYHTGENVLYDLILSMSPALYWPLGNSEQYQTGKLGTDDHSANGRNGTGFGGTASGAAKLSDEPVDSAYSFNGASGFIQSTYSPWTASTDRTFVFMAYRSAATAGVDTFLGGDGGTAAPRLMLEYDGNDNVRWVRTTAQAVVVGQGSTPLPVGTPVLMMLTLDASVNVAELFAGAKGVSYREKAITQGFSTPGNFMVGAFGSTAGSFFTGNLSHVAVFERKLTRADYRRLFHAAFRRGWGGSRLRSAIMQTAPDFYVPMNAEYGMIDQSAARRFTQAVVQTVDLGNQASLLPKDAADSSQDFDGTNGRYISPPGYRPFVSGSAVWTFMIQNFNLDSTASAYHILLNGGATGPGLSYKYDVAGDWVEFWPNAAAGSPASWNIPLMHTFTSFVNLFLTWSESTKGATLYINGVSQGTIAMGAATHGALGDMRIGCRENDTFPWKGWLSHAAFWERFVTPTEIARIADTAQKGVSGRIIEAAA